MLTLKTVLNHVYKIKGFVYEKITLRKNSLSKEEIIIEVVPRKKSNGKCPICKKKCPTHHRQKQPRLFAFIPLWGMAVFLNYRMRRINCKTHGILTEWIPWAEGKLPLCNCFRIFLGKWARLISWTQVGKSFGVSYHQVASSVEWMVAFGLKNRILTGIKAIGIDEVCVRLKTRFWMLVYQIDDGHKRLLWIGYNRKKETLNKFFDKMGENVTNSIEFICTDMWRGFFSVIAKRAPQALHILDRFHIRKNLNEAVDLIRKEESKALEKAGFLPVLKKMRWAFLKNRKNWTTNQRKKMREIKSTTLRTLRAYLLVECFNHFWSYESKTWAGKFFDSWSKKVMYSKLEPLKKKVRTLRKHRSILLNYFEGKKRYNSGVVEGLNNKMKLTVKKSYGFRTDKYLEIALYHCLGNLPEPKVTHRFFL